MEYSTSEKKELSNTGQLLFFKFQAVYLENQLALLTYDVSLIVSIGVEFGMVGFTGEPVEVKYAGSGKVLKVV